MPLLFPGSWISIVFIYLCPHYVYLARLARTSYHQDRPRFILTASSYGLACERIGKAIFVVVGVTAVVVVVVYDVLDRGVNWKVSLATRALGFRVSRGKRADHVTAPPTLKFHLSGLNCLMVSG